MIDPGSAYRNPDRSGLADLAERQHGVVTLGQLEALGFTKWSVNRRVGAAQLHRLHRGVYAVGHRRIGVRGRWLAAVLACGREAVLSHHAAAALWELRASPTGRIDVTAPGEHHVLGVRCHRTRSLPHQDRTMIDAIPVTSLNRTLLDEAESLSMQRLRSSLESTQRRDLLDIRGLNALLARSPGRRGAPRLSRALAELHDEAPWLQSDLERRFLELVRAAGIEEPQCNALVAGELVDFFWPRQRLVVEVDGYGVHKTKRAFEDDRRKDARLQIAGFRVVRVTADRIDHDANHLTGDLRRLIASAPAT